MDIPDIDLVVQFMVALSLSVLTQHFGRAGRSGQPAMAILFTEPSVFQVRRKASATTGASRAAVIELEDAVKEEPLNDDSIVVDLSPDTLGLDQSLNSADAVTEYRKKMETGMQEWCLALGCRSDVSDKYFNNPPRQNGMLY